MSTRLMLDTGDSVSDEFLSPGGIIFAHCDTHAGGTWVLQLKSPGDEWTDADDVSFADVDILQFRVPQGALCRFNGGSAGARIYVSGART